MVTIKQLNLEHYMSRIIMNWNLHKTCCFVGIFGKGKGVPTQKFTERSAGTKNKGNLKKEKHDHQITMSCTLLFD